MSAAEELRSGALGVIEVTPTVLRRMLSGLPAELVTAAGAEGWSPADVVAHLIVAGRLGAIARTRRVLLEDRPELDTYDEHDELKRSGLRGKPIDELLEIFEDERHAALGELRGLRGARLKRTGVHATAGEVTVRHLLHQAAFHDATHVAQIASMLAAAFEDDRGGLGEP